MRFLLLLALVAVHSAWSTTWDVDSRCLRRRHLEDWDARVLIKEPSESENDGNLNEEGIRHLTERDLASNLRVTLKIHWQVGYCWQDEWRERKWCIGCFGDSCNENDKLVIQVCENVARQKFSWIPTNGGGRLKVADMKLCFEGIGTDMYRLKNCSTSTKQVLVGFNASRPFELYPLGFERRMCFSNTHHPEVFEEIFTFPCALPRAEHTNRWEVCVPSSGGNSSGTGGNSSLPLLVTPTRTCSPSNPCRECEGDCDSDSDCKGILVCFQRDANVPIPGCKGRDLSRSDYCVDPRKST